MNKETKKTQNSIIGTAGGLRYALTFDVFEFEFFCDVFEYLKFLITFVFFLEWLLRFFLCALSFACFRLTLDLQGCFCFSLCFG